LTIRELIGSIDTSAFARYLSGETSHNRASEESASFHLIDYAVTRLNEHNTDEVQAARAHIAEGSRLFAVAGRSTKAQFIKLYGAAGAKDDLGAASQGGCRRQTLPGGAQGEVIE
jgi:hypothetical protein